MFGHKTGYGAGRRTGYRSRDFEPSEPPTPALTLTYTPTDATPTIHGFTPLSVDDSTPGQRVYTLAPGDYGFTVEKEGYVTGHQIVEYELGATETVTLNLAAEPDPSAYPIQRYVDPVGGSDSNDGTSGNAWATIAHALDQSFSLRSGGAVAVNLAAGRYTESISDFTSTGGNPVCFTTANKGDAVWTGADEITSWTAASGVYYTTWSNNWGESVNPWEGIREITALGLRREMAFVNDILMTQVGTLAECQAATSTLFVDEAADRLYLNPPVGVNPTSLGSDVIEISVRDSAIRLQSDGAGGNFIFHNLVVEKFATPINTDAVAFPDINDITLIDTDVRMNNWGGVGGASSTHTDGFRIIRGDFTWNGSCAVNTNNCHTDVIIDGIDSSHIGWRSALGGERGWAMGNKFFDLRAALIRDIVSHESDTRTIWPDIDNSGLLIVNPTIHDSRFDAVFLEASPGPIIMSGGSILRSASKGIRASAVSRVGLYGVTLGENAVAQIDLGGVYDRLIENGETEAEYTVTTESWTVDGCTIRDLNGAAPLWRYSEGVTSGNMTSFLASSVIDNNTYLHSDFGAPFYAPTAPTDFATWQSETSQDANSTFSSAGVAVQNLLLSPSDFSTNWTQASGVTVTTNTDMAPDDTLTADTIEDSSDSAQQGVYQEYEFGGGALTFTYSIFIKKTLSSGPCAGIYMRYFNGGTTVEANVTVDPFTGLHQRTAFAPGDLTATIGVEDEGDYWRAWITAENPDAANTSIRCAFYPARTAALASGQSSSNVGALAVWGAQLNPGDLANYGDLDATQKLAWEPPAGWESYTTYNIPTSGGVITFDDNTDYRLIMPATPVTETLTIKGGRNLVMIGGECKRDAVTYTTAPGANEATQSAIRVWLSDNAGAQTTNNGRIVHIEGVLMHGYHLSDGIIGNAPEVDLRIQNCRVEQGMWYRDMGRDGVGSPHGDILQPWGGVGWMRVDGLTGLVAGQGLMLKPDFNEPNQGNMSFRRMNLRLQENPDVEANDAGATWPQPSTDSGPRYYWWTDGEEGDIFIEDGTVWFNHPSRAFSSAGIEMFWPESNTYGSDGTGTYVIPYGTLRDWSAASGGKIYDGNPPTGDFVTTAGISYTSPGYDAGLQHAVPPDVTAAISVVDSSAAVAFAESVSATVPATAAANDLVLVFAASSRWPIMDTPTGLTQRFDQLSGTASADGHLLMYSGVVGVDCSASDVISIGDPGGSSNNYGILMVTLRAADGSVPLFTHEVDFLATTGSTSPTAPTLAAPTNGLLLFVAQAARSASGNSQTPPAGYAEIEDVNRAYVCLMGATKDISAAGATGAASSTSDAGTAAWVAAHVFVYAE